MHDYFYQKFPGQFRRLKRHPADRSQLNENIDLMFFGWNKWQDVEDDFWLIPLEDRPRFILCLFMVVMTDVCLYTYYNDVHKSWSKITQYPKFGGPGGFGATGIKNPFKVLLVPEEKKLVDVNKVVELIPEFVKFFLQETDNYFKTNLPNVNTAEFFNKIRNDRSYQINRGKIVKGLKKELEALLTKCNALS